MRTSSKSMIVVAAGLGLVVLGFLGYRKMAGSSGLTKKFVEDYYSCGNTGVIKEGDFKLVYYNKDNNPIRPYMRVLIRNKALNPEIYANLDGEKN